MRFGPYHRRAFDPMPDPLVRRRGPEQATAESSCDSLRDTASSRRALIQGAIPRWDEPQWLVQQRYGGKSALTCQCGHEYARDLLRVVEMIRSVLLEPVYNSLLSHLGP